MNSHTLAITSSISVSDSVPWREQLLSVANTLERRKRQRRWTERTSFLVERDVMVSAYAVRKLKEAHKVSDALAAHRWAIVEHVLIGRAPDLHGRFEPWEYYDLESGEDISLNMTGVCNQIIHSWIWMISATKNDEFNGIFVSSDRQRRRSLYFIHVDALTALFRAVGNEDIIEITMTRDNNGEMQYSGIKGQPFDAQLADS